PQQRPQRGGPADSGPYIRQRTAGAALWYSKRAWRPVSTGHDQRSQPLGTAGQGKHAGANVNAKNDYGATPMSEAALLGNAGMLDKLLKAGADVESPNLDGQTALMVVARTGNVEAARVVLSHGANVNAKEHWREQTALMWAAA